MSVDSRSIEFLRNSESIAGFAASAVRDVADRPQDSGHVGAFMRSQRLAQSSEPLVIDEVERWHAMIAEEQRRFAVEAGGQGGARGLADAGTSPSSPPLRAVLEDVAWGEPYRGAADVVRRLARFTMTFAAARPFSTSSGLVGRLVVNCLVRHAGAPILVFHAGETLASFTAVGRERAYCSFFASKLREAVFDADGRVCLRRASNGWTDVYERPNGGALLREWHDLREVE